MAYQIEMAEGIATFTINRLAKRNAVNKEVVNGLESFLNKVENNADVNYVVVTGSEKTFCAGGDLAEYQTLWTAEDAYPMLSRMTKLLYRLATLPMPVIALINGTAVGGGCEIATACDYRIMSREAKAGFIQGTLAITTGWGGATLLFEKEVQYDRSLKMLSEANLYSAEDLHTFGWATELYDGDAQVGLTQFLQGMSTIHPSVHRAYKQIVIQKWQQNLLRDRMLEEAKQCSILWEEESHHQAVKNFLQKKIVQKKLIQ